jgi:hypothetical protein
LWIHIKTMLDQLLGHPWHIRWFPCEYVSVSPQEADEREFLFVTQACADDGCLGWVAFLELDLLESHITCRLDA